MGDTMLVQSRRIDPFMDFSRKAHAIRDARVFRPLPRFGECIFANIKAGNFRVGVPGNLHGLSAGCAAKVNDRFIRQFIPDVWSEQLLHFAASVVGSG